jgi:hypothetical protein
MKNKIIFVFVLSVGAGLYTSAQTAYYIPKALIIPLHNNARQLHASVGYGGGYDLNASYAFIEHFALFTGATFNEGSRNRISFLGGKSKIVKNDRTLQFGVGYFKDLAKSKAIMEWFVDYETNKVNNYWYSTSDPSGASHTSAKYNSYFLQENIGWQKSFYNVGFGTRFVYSKYFSLEFYDDNPNSSYIKNSYENLSGFTFEPALFVGFKIDKIYLNFQVGAALPLTKKKVKYIMTQNLPGQPYTREDYVTESLSGAFARICLQRNFNFRKIKTSD